MRELSFSEIMIAGFPKVAIIMNKPTYNLIGILDGLNIRSIRIVDSATEQVAIATWDLSEEFEANNEEKKINLAIRLIKYAIRKLEYQVFNIGRVYANEDNEDVELTELE